MIKDKLPATVDEIRALMKELAKFIATQKSQNLEKTFHNKTNLSPEIPDFSPVEPEKTPVLFPSENFAGATGARRAALESAMCHRCTHSRRAMAALKPMS
jgi:hypothetical protein